MTLSLRLVIGFWCTFQKKTLERIASCLVHGMAHTVSLRRKILTLLYVRKYTFLNKVPFKYTNNGSKFVLFNFLQGIIGMVQSLWGLDVPQNGLIEYWNHVNHPMR